MAPGRESCEKKIGARENTRKRFEVCSASPASKWPLADLPALPRACLAPRVPVVSKCPVVLCRGFDLLPRLAEVRGAPSKPLYFMKLASLAMEYARESAILGRFTRVRRFVGDPTRPLQNVEPQIPRKARNLQVHPCTCQPQYCIFMQYCGWVSDHEMSALAFRGLLQA